MVELTDLISEFTQFYTHLDEVVNLDDLSCSEIDENLQVCSENLAILTEQLELITCELEERDRVIMRLKCQLQETTAARDSLANLIKIETEVNRNQKDELENIAEINSELEEENRNLISKINEKQSLLNNLKNCEIDIDRQLEMKKEMMDFDYEKGAFLNLSESYNKLKNDCQTHLRIIDDLKLNVSSLEGLTEIVKNLENKNSALLWECEKKGMLNTELEGQLREKAKLIIKLTEKLEKSTERCRQLDNDLNNILNDSKNSRNNDSCLGKQMGDFNHGSESCEIMITTNLQASETSKPNETDNEKEELLINEKNSLVAQIQESDKSLRKYQHELEISKDQIRKLASLLSENKRHYKSELSKFSENCEKLAYENLCKDIEIECLKSNNSNNPSPKSRGKPTADDQTNAKFPIQCPKQRVNSRDGSTRYIETDLSEKNESDYKKEESTEINNDLPGMREEMEEPKGVNKAIIKEEPKCLNKEEIVKEDSMNEVEEKLIVTKSVGVMTDCDEKVGKTVGAEELLRGLISRLPLAKDKGKFENLGKKFKSIDDLRRLQGKAGQMTEQNVRDILIEVKKFYAITIADMQKNFKAELEKSSVSHEVALSKVKMQQQEKISQLKREHKERVDKILAAHEDEIKKINTQHQLILSMNKVNKTAKKK